MIFSKKVIKFAVDKLSQLWHLEQILVLHQN